MSNGCLRLLDNTPQLRKVRAAPTASACIAVGHRHMPLARGRTNLRAFLAHENEKCEFF
jgi:hypothetical protein